MKMTRVLQTGLLLALMATDAWTPVAVAANTDYIYCSIRDNTHSAAYYSDVFLGDYGNSVKYQNAFQAHVDGKYSGVIGLASCLFTKSSHESRAKQDESRATDRRAGYKQLIDTGWTY